jgi:dihydroxyacetone kinase-like predicted kinase
VHDPARRSTDDVVAMAEAAAATRRGEITVAAEEAITWVGRSHVGDILGFVDGEVVLIEPAPATAEGLVRAAVGVLRRMLDVGGELVTMLLGAAAPEGMAQAIADRVAEEHPEAELVVYSGGQPGEIALIGVE